MIIRVVSPFKSGDLWDDEAWGESKLHDPGMQRYKMYFEGIPLHSQIKIYEFKGFEA